MHSLVFSKSKEGTVHKITNVLANVQVPVVPGLSNGGLIFAKSTKCGQCRGAK
jgi:hypothetical protein